MTRLTTEILKIVLITLVIFERLEAKTIEKCSSREIEESETTTTMISPSSSTSSVSFVPLEFSNSSITMTTFDSNQNGFIDFSEFQTLVQSLYADFNSTEKEPIDSKILANLFTSFDTAQIEQNQPELNSSEFQRLYDAFIRKILSPVSALIVVDVQNDFIDGSLQVPEAVKIIQPINKLVENVPFDFVFYTLDWHPSNHLSFLDNVHLRKLDNSSEIQNPEDAKLYDTVIFEGGIEQKLWPRHCVQNTWGAELHPDLKVKESGIMIQKGVNPEIDSYSALWDNNKIKATPLVDHLKEKGVTDVFVCGLASDVCVAATALDSLQLGYRTIFIEDASKGISAEEIENKKRQIKGKHGIVVNSEEVESLVKGQKRRPELGTKLAEELIKKNQLQN